MAKTSNEIKELYKKVRSNLLSQVRRLEKMGFKGARERVPKIPKTIKPESISNLERLTKNKYRKLKEGLISEKGETVREVEYEARKARTERGKQTKQERKKAKRLREYVDEQTQWEYDYYGQNPFEDTMNETDYADNVISNFMDDIGQWNDAFYDYMSHYIMELQQHYTNAEVAEMITKATKAGVVPSVAERYNTEYLLQYTAKMFSYLPEIGNFQKDQFMDRYAQVLGEHYQDEFDSMRKEYKTERRNARRAYRGLVE